MNWKLSRISIPVFDLETSKTFYNSILNNQTKNNYHHHLDTDEECFISGGNIDLLHFLTYTTVDLYFPQK
jgi:predicted lactoylglutathione lyase